MPGIAVSNHVIARNAFGQFIRQVEVAGPETMADIARDGAQLSRDLAPVGHKNDPRTPHLRDSIRGVARGTTAHWEATARHALPQETGGAAHLQTGEVSFFWEREGRDWTPGPNQINHPGNPAHPYLRPAYEAMMGRWMNYARRYYPG